MSELHESADGALAVELLWRRWASAGIVVHVHSQHSEERLLGLSHGTIAMLLQNFGVSGNYHTHLFSFQKPGAPVQHELQGTFQSGTFSRDLGVGGSKPRKHAGYKQSKLHDHTPVV